MVQTRGGGGGAGDSNPHNNNNNTTTTNQDDGEQSWSQRELRSQYRVKRTLQHWPSQLSRRHRTIKMPRVVFPESEDSEPEKFSRSRRRRPVRVFFEDTSRLRRRDERPHRNNVMERNLRPLEPNNYMEDSDKPIQETESSVRRSGRQRKLIHHSFNESWITNELKVKGYPRLFGRHRRMSTSSESSMEDESPQRKQIPNGQIDSDDEKLANKKTIHLTRQSIKNDPKTDEDRTTDGVVENGETTMDSDKSDGKTEDNENNTEKTKRQSDEVNETVTSSNNRNLRLRRGRSENNNSTRENTRNLRSTRKDYTNRISNQHDSDDSESNTSDGTSEDSDIVVRRQPRRSNRTRKPRNAYIEDKPPTQGTSSSSSPTSSSSSDELNVTMKNKTKGRQKIKGDHSHHSDRALKEIQPVELDGSIKFTSVGGLDGHIRCLREMVLFPLMYPQVFEKFGTRPPKGVLFHGPPGTGKTLLARALANECSVRGGQKVSFFMRKGADCLKKWVGESERNIKLLFQQANKMKPSIIFFDEIDALAPVRSVRQEQVHTSVVGTLLAEMDGLCDRGEVIVIGATNRVDAVDPALRRAGRFDRELFFPPPACTQRVDILKILTSHWKNPPSPETINYIAGITNGYGGSDLKALCSESVLRAFERIYPQVYQSQHALLIDIQNVEVAREDMVSAMKGLVAAGSRCNPPPAKPLLPHLTPLFASNLESANNLITKLFPLAVKTESNSSKPQNSITANSFSTYWSSVVLVKGSCSSTYLAPALLATMEHCAVREISLSTLHQSVYLTVEQSILSIFSDIRRCAQGHNSCIIYTPGIDSLWKLLGEHASTLLLQQWQEVSSISNCLFMGTCECDYLDLPHQVQNLFPSYKECIYSVKEPTVQEITNFLKPIFVVRPLIPSHNCVDAILPELPRAPTPPPPKLSAVEEQKIERREANVLRELRIFLRDVCRKLATNRRFYKFTKPVDLEEVTDYLDIVKKPMDLETMMTKVDLHRYNCAREFLEDIDLICANALEYNPDRTSSDKQIRHEACSLRDHAYALIEVEMDSDFEGECQKITQKRAGKVDQDVPSFIYTENQKLTKPEPPHSDLEEIAPNPNGNSSNPILNSATRRKRKKKSLWSKGIAKKHKSQGCVKDIPIITDEESKENKPIDHTLVNGDGPIRSDEVNHSVSDDQSRSATTSSARRGSGDPQYSSSSTKDQLSMEDNDTMMDTLDTLSNSKVLNNQLSPSRHSDRKTSNNSTSTPHRRKPLPSLEHSMKEKLIVNKEELETALTKCVKAVKNIGMKKLLDLHCQLDRIVASFESTNDRSSLCSQLQTTVDKFVSLSSSK